MAKLKRRSSLTDRLGDTAGAPPPSFRDEPDDPDPITGVAFYGTTIIVLALLVLGAVWFGTRKIERHLVASAEETLQGAGINTVSASADGADLSLNGTVDSPEDVGRSADLVAAVNGVRSVTTELTVRDPVELTLSEVDPDPLTIAWTAAGVTVTGTVAPDSVAQVVASLESVFDLPVDHAGLVGQERLVGESEWLPKAIELAQIVSGALSEGQVLVNPAGNVAQVSGELGSRQAKRELETQLEDALADQYAFVSGLILPDAPPPPPREQVVELQANFDDLIEGKVVEFQINSDIITPVGTALLDEILAALAQFPDVPVEIGGHADSQGSEEANLELSERRATAVLAYLVAAGEDPERFVVIGYGESRPIADNTTAEGRQRNRRIEFTALEE